MPQIKTTLINYYRIICRAKPKSPSYLDLWLKSKGWHLRQDFYAVLFIIPFVLTVITGLAAEQYTKSFHYGVNLVVVLLGYFGITLYVDIFGRNHLLSYKFSRSLKLLPISINTKVVLSSAIEIFGYKLYILFTGIAILAGFNYFYVPELNFAIHPKVIGLFVAVFFLSCAIGVIINSIDLGMNRTKRKIIYWGSRFIVLLLFIFAYRLKVNLFLDRFYKLLCFIFDAYFFVAVIIIILTSMFLFIASGLVLKQR